MLSMAYRTDQQIFLQLLSPTTRYSILATELELIEFDPLLILSLSNTAGLLIPHQRCCLQHTPGLGRFLHHCNFLSHCWVSTFSPESYFRNIDDGPRKKPLQQHEGNGSTDLRQGLLIIANNY